MENLKLVFSTLITSTLILLGNNAIAAPFSAKNAVTIDKQKAYDALMDCPKVACVVNKMKKLGVTEPQIQFIKTIEKQGERGYLEEFKEKGMVDLGLAMYMRANTNNEYLMLNGSPSIVRTEISGDIAGLKKDPTYKKAKSDFKNLEFWGSSASFVNVKQDSKGIHYTFSYPMRDGCHACANPYDALVQFNFNKKGVFLNKQLVKLVKN